MASFLDYYALSYNPFNKQSMKEKDRFVSSDFRQMTSRLEYLKNVRGIGVFTSRPGMGKTFGLRCFSKTLAPNKDHMEYICLSTVSVAEFYRELCEVLGVSMKGGKPGRFKAIQEQSTKKSASHSYLLLTKPSSSILPSSMISGCS